MKFKRIILSIFLGMGFLSASVAGLYDDWPDDSVCLWLDMRPGNANYLAEVKKRNITCQNGKAVSSFDVSSNNTIPENAHPFGNSWRCNVDYYKDNLSCKKLPENAHNFVYEGGDGWECDWQFVKSGNGCVKEDGSANAIPNNAYATGFDSQGWKCNSGFTQSGNECINKNSSNIIPENSYKTASGWKCKSGYFRLETSDYCYSLPDNSYALSPIGFECKSGYKKSEYDYVCIKSSNTTSASKKITIPAATYNKSANGYTNPDGTVTVCFANFYKIGNRCHKVPENAYSLIGSVDWKCYETHQKSGNRCIKKGEAKTVLGKILSWVGLMEDNKSKSKSSTQKKVYIPANAYASGSSWKCNYGYTRSGNSCIKNIYIPANAYAYGNSWKCYDGFKKVGTRCEKLTYKDSEFWGQEVEPGVNRMMKLGIILSNMGNNNQNNTPKKDCRYNPDTGDYQVCLSNIGMGCSFFSIERC